METPLKPTAVRLAIIEDQSDYRAMVVRFFNQSSGYRCVCDCGSVEEAIEQVPRFKPDVALVDLLFKASPAAMQSARQGVDESARIAREGRAGIHCIRELKARLSSCEFLVLTQHENPELIFQALCAGAAGYCLKRSTPAELLQAVVAVHAGQGFISPAIARYVVEFFREPARPEKLTAAEEQILQFLKTGKTIKEIARDLDRSEETIKTHNKHILAKLGAGSRAELLLRFGIRSPRLRE